MDKEEFVENLIEITQDCLIVKTQAGFKKLLKKLNIHFRENDNRLYSYDVVQLTKNERAFRTVKYCNVTQMYNFISIYLFCKQIDLMI